MLGSAAIASTATTSVASGTGGIQVVRSGTRSVVSRAFATSPLKLLTPRNHGSAAWIYTATYGGGLVGGDALALTIDVGEDAAALLSTQASTKVYRSAIGASARLDATIAERGLLVIAPDPVVGFRGSSYRQLQEIDLSASAGLVLVDWISCGRRASGERWAFDRYSSRTVVRCDGLRVFFDGLDLRAEDGDLRARMGRFDVVAVIVLAGARVSADVDALLDGCATLPVPIRADILLSSARLEAGAVLRIAGTSIEGVTRAIRERLSFIPSLLGDDPWSRKW